MLFNGLRFLLQTELLTASAFVRYIAQEPIPTGYNHQAAKYLFIFFFLNKFIMNFINATKQRLKEIKKKKFGSRFSWIVIIVSRSVLYIYINTVQVKTLRVMVVNNNYMRHLKSVRVQFLYYNIYKY